MSQFNWSNSSFIKATHGRNIRKSVEGCGVEYKINGLRDSLYSVQSEHASDHTERTIQEEKEI